LIDLISRRGFLSLPRLFTLSAPSLLLLLSSVTAPALAGSIKITGPCSVTPDAFVDFNISATFEENLVPGAYETDVIFDPTVIQAISFKSPITGQFGPGTFSNLIGQGALAVGGLSCSDTPPTPTSDLGKVRFKAVGPVGSGTMISFRAPTFLTSDGAFKAVGTVPTFLSITGNADRDCDSVPDKVDNCPGTYNPSQTDANGNGLGDDCDVRRGVLASFTARVSSHTATLKWVTSAEPDISGFLVLRGLDADGPWERISDALIPSRGDASRGATYHFRDRVPSRLATVYYLVQVLDLAGVVVDSLTIQINLRPNARPPAFVLPPEGAGQRDQGPSRR